MDAPAELTVTASPKQVASVAARRLRDIDAEYRDAHGKALARMRVAADAWAAHEASLKGIKVGDVVEQAVDRHGREIWWTERWRVDMIVGGVNPWVTATRLDDIVLHCTKVKADGTIGKRTGVKVSIERVHKVEPPR